MILSEELIGSSCKIVESTDKARIGLAGTIVDETKNTFILRTDKGDKIVPKKECSFVIELDKRKYRIDGKMLVGRPEDRVKQGIRQRKKWHMPKFFFN
ncbi:MAG: ribonuclease P protein component 1 [Candidatus Altiarchaeota archaeon]|nr:ribonuclease P protein component 1 [Candidatus Altiarchaeota archaeon]